MEQTIYFASGYFAGNNDRQSQLIKVDKFGNITGISLISLLDKESAPPSIIDYSSIEGSYNGQQPVSEVIKNLYQKRGAIEIKEYRTQDPLLNEATDVLYGLAKIHSSGIKNSHLNRGTDTKLEDLLRDMPLLLAEIAGGDKVPRTGIRDSVDNLKSLLRSLK